MTASGGPNPKEDFDPGVPYLLADLDWGSKSARILVFAILLGVIKVARNSFQ